MKKNIDKNKPEIGIITFHKELNVGANLQSFALNRFLINLGHNTEIIDFIPNSSVDNRNFFRKFLHVAKLCLVPKARAEAILKNKFRKFQHKYYILSKKKYNGDSEFLKSDLPYDILISGSDQILNLTLSGNSISYYLPLPNKYKVSYASSFGRIEISENEKTAIKEYLPDFNSLSFREESGFQIVSSMIETKEKNIVLDPVFLLSKEEWNSLIKKSLYKNYVLIYAMEKSEWLLNTIHSLHSTNPNLKMILVKGGNFSLKSDCLYKTYDKIDPISFLSLINHSEYVITNSFHGLSFSIIFGKKIYCCSHSTRNTRLRNLLSLAKEKDKIISEKNLHLSYIEGYCAYKNLQNSLSKSKTYLENIINIKK